MLLGSGGIGIKIFNYFRGWYVPFEPSLERRAQLEGCGMQGRVRSEMEFGLLSGKPDTAVSSCHLWLEIWAGTMAAWIDCTWNSWRRDWWAHQA